VALADQEADQEPEVELRWHVHAPRVVSPSCYTGNVAARPGGDDGHAEGGAGRARVSGHRSALKPIRSMYTPSNGLSRAGRAAQQMMVTETAYGPALNRYAAYPHSTRRRPSRRKKLTVWPAISKRSGNRENERRTGGIGMPALPAAVAVMIYRLISVWLVLLVGWVIFLVISARRARRAAAEAAPAAVNLTTSTSTSTSTGLGRWHRAPHPLDFRSFGSVLMTGTAARARRCHAVRG